jgi:hypothetical protein
MNMGKEKFSIFTAYLTNGDGVSLIHVPLELHMPKLVVRSVELHRLDQLSRRKQLI